MRQWDEGQWADNIKPLGVTGAKKGGRVAKKGGEGGGGLYGGKLWRVAGDENTAEGCE